MTPPAKPVVRHRKLPPEESLAHVPKMFRAIGHPDFMRFGRPDDYGELREKRRMRGKKSATRPGEPPEVKPLTDIPALLRAMGKAEGRFQPHEQWKYMLDADVCVCLIERTSPELERRLAECRKGEVVVSAVTLGELRYGAAAVPDADGREKRSAAVDAIQEGFPIAPFDDDAALAYAAVRHVDPKRNIRAMEKIIAAHAIALDLILVTNNLKDFQKFQPPLRTENWAAKRH